MFIDDGKGNGKRVGINASNRMLADAVASTSEHHTNHHDGLAFNVLVDQAASAGDDCIFYMENTSELDLVVEGFDLSISGAGEVYFNIDDKGTRNGGSDVTPVNLNAGSGKTAVGNFEYGADLDGGSATLSGGTEFQRYVFRAATNTQYFNFNQDVILTKSGTITVWCTTTATINLTMNFNYHNAEE